jgi:hypothetical protein
MGREDGGGISKCYFLMNQDRLMVFRAFPEIPRNLLTKKGIYD